MVSVINVRYLRCDKSWIVSSFEQCVNHAVFMTPEGYKKECQLYEYFFTLCINHTPISATAQKIKAHIYSSKNPTALPRNLKKT